MDFESPTLPPNPELLTRQPAWFKPVFRLCIAGSVLFAVLAVVYIFFGASTPKFQDKADLNTAISNLRQIGLPLDEFESNYGQYPSSGIDLFSPKHPIWKGKAPTIYYPGV